MIIGSGALLLLGVVASQLPSIGAALILHPLHRHVVAAPPTMCQEVTFSGDGVSLKGWRGQGTGSRRGTLIYLHGVADNRASGAGIMERFRKRGFDVVAYDSRAQGESGGEASTYGFYEKEDLRRVMDTVGPGPIVLVGSSFGAAVALQTAGVDEALKKTKQKASSTMTNEHNEINCYWKMPRNNGRMHASWKGTSIFLSPFFCQPKLRFAFLAR